MINGKCWIYKRAILTVPGQPSIILEHTDGTEEFDTTVVNTNDNKLFYNWNLRGHNIPIPLNVQRNKVLSMVQTGSIDLSTGTTIQWECIYGKFQSYPEYYMKKLLSRLPYILLFLIVILMTSK